MSSHKALNHLAECLKIHVAPMVENHFEMLWKILEKASCEVTMTPSKFFQNIKLQMD